MKLGGVTNRLNSRAATRPTFHALEVLPSYTTPMVSHHGPVCIFTSVPLQDMDNLEVVSSRGEYKSVPAAQDHGRIQGVQEAAGPCLGGVEAHGAHVTSHSPPTGLIINAHG